MVAEVAEVLDLRSLTPGTRLRVRRIVLGLTQGQMAEALGEHRPRISEAEHDRVGGQKTVRLQDAIDEALRRLEAVRETQPTPAGVTGVAH